MPKKPNSHGKDQEYVPKGNGDASGEYADDGGSNKHFTLFSKPDDYSKPVEASGSSEVAEEPKGEVEEKGAVAETKAEEKPNNDFAKIDELAAQTRLNELDTYNKYSVLNAIDYAIKKSGWSWSDPNRDYIGEKYDELKGIGIIGDWSKDDYDKVVDLVKESRNLKGDYYIEVDGGVAKTMTPGFEHLVGSMLMNKEQADQKFAEIKAVKVREATEKRDRLITKNDAEIKKSFGENTVVAFGKGYKKQQLEEIAQATQIITSDFGELKDFCKQIGDKSVLNNYNGYSRDIENKYIQKYSLSNQTIAAHIHNADNTVSAIVYNGAVAKKRDAESVKYEYDSNFHSSDKEIGTLYHEMGHMTDSMVSNYHKKIKGNGNWQLALNICSELKEKVAKLYDENDAHDLNERFREKYGRHYNAYRAADEMLFDGLIKEYVDKGERPYKISQYGNTNQKEFVAECFSAHYTGMNNELATRVVNLYKDAYNKLKEL